MLSQLHLEPIVPDNLYSTQTIPRSMGETSLEHILAQLLLIFWHSKNLLILAIPLESLDFIIQSIAQSVRLFLHPFHRIPLFVLFKELCPGFPIAPPRWLWQLTEEINHFRKQIVFII